MSSVWLTSDTHFGHKGVCIFTQADGVTPLRPWDTPDEMDEAMVVAWNKRVKPEDRVYHLGDVVINRKALKILDRLNGRKVLIKGNHCIFKLSDYTPYFEDIRAYHKLDNFILSHIPIHPASLARWTDGNIHGHLHSNNVMKPRGVDVRTGEILYGNEIDPRYYCVCVEQTPDFAPILYEDVKNNFFARKKLYSPT